MALGDLNGDCDLDLAVTVRGEDALAVSQGGPGGSFASPRRTPVGAYPQAVTMGDVDGDADLDIAVANYLRPSFVALLENTTPGGG